jgi:predicted AlkP superfamily phosphohydrolase/phosphomutase
MLYTIFYTSKENNTKTKPSNKIIKLKQAEIIETEIYGPRKQTKEGISDLTSKMIINLKEKTIRTDKSEIKFDKNKWTDWITLSFSAGFMRKIQGTFKAFVQETNPFEMFVTSLQIDPENPSLDISNPKEYSKTIVEEIKQKYYTLGIAEETDGLNDGIISPETFLAQAKEIDAEKEKIFWNEFEKFEEGIFAFVFDSSDRIQHMFWQSDKKIIEDYLIEKDKLIGKVLKKIDDKTQLIILSDHGFTEYDYSINVNKFLEQEGYLKTKSEKTKYPFENIDWSKTKAYSVGFNSIYLNLEGRESQGIVKESEKEKLIKEIKNKLENLKHKDKKVINKIYSSEEVWTGNLSLAPEMIVGFLPKYRMSWKSALGEIDENLIEKNDKPWNADHLMDPEFVKGIFFSNKKIDAPKKQEDVLKIILED